MTKSYKEYLSDITTFVFDFDGVFTDGTVQISGDGSFSRSLNVKDSYAIQYAVKKGFRIAIISGGSLGPLTPSFKKLGVTNLYFETSNKLTVYQEFLESTKLNADEVLFMGDDIPDFELMKVAGVSTCPADAAEEIKRVSHYVSRKKGGRGCIRDIIEQTMKVQGNWFDKDATEW